MDCCLPGFVAILSARCGGIEFQFWKVGKNSAENISAAEYFIQHNFIYLQHIQPPTERVLMGYRITYCKVYCVFSE